MPIEETRQVEIVVNGENRRVAAGASVLDLLASLGLDPERVAVELDRDILPKGRWGQTALAGGERLEIVHFVGGG